MPNCAAAFCARVRSGSAIATTSADCTACSARRWCVLTYPAPTSAALNLRKSTPFLAEGTLRRQTCFGDRVSLHPHRLYGAEHLPGRHKIEFAISPASFHSEQAIQRLQATATQKP